MSENRLLDIPTQKNSRLTYREIRFVDEYMVTGIGKEAYRRAYPECGEGQLSQGSSRLLHKPEVMAEIAKRRAELTKSSIMDTQELLQLYTSIARGEVKDQFGLDATLKDRLAASKELYKYLVEMPNKDADKDNQLTIKIVR